MVADARSSDTQRSRRVEPVSEEFDPRAVFRPEQVARPWLAAVLVVGPVLCLVGLAGWLRLLVNVALPVPPKASWSALGVDALLLALFVVPHSTLARGVGRRWLNRPLGPAGERPLYVLISGLGMCALGWGWQTTGPVLWDFTGPYLLASRIVQLGGLLLTVWALLVSGLLSVFGLPHLHAMRTGAQPPSPELVALPPYRYMRQPVNAGVLLMLIGLPEATIDRVFLSLVLGIWILLATPFEERDARMTFGQAYALYQERTPRWIPRFRRRAE